MGTGNLAFNQSIALTLEAPSESEFELTLFGPGYGESMVLHVGDGDWLVVDSCVNAQGVPRAVEYLESIGVDPGRQVKLIVATHWHDDHIRGMANLMSRCRSARFCCAAALAKEEFLAAVHALENRNVSSAGSGVREMYRVFSELRERSGAATFAQANQRILSRRGCEVWSLSPDDAVYQSFIQSIGELVPGEGEAKHRVPAGTSNRLSVVLWIGLGDIVTLLGADLEKPGWVKILQSRERPMKKASVFKIPHHGSRNAHVPAVWKDMLDPEPVAVLTPWRRGKGSLPTEADVARILSHASNAYASTDHKSNKSSGRKRISAVERTIRESGISLRHSPLTNGAVQLRRTLDGKSEWRIEAFGTACHLRDFFK